MNLKDDNICNYTQGFFDRSIFVEANLKKRFLVKQFFACLNQNMDFQAKLTKHFFFRTTFGQICQITTKLNSDFC